MSSDEESPCRKREKFTSEKQASEDGNASAGENCGDSFFGPALPPHLMAKSRDQNDLVHVPCARSEQKQRVIGPELPAHLVRGNDVEEEDVTREAEDEGPTFGPGVSLMADSSSITVPSYFHTSKSKADTPEVKRRETWMLELPPERASSFGLGPRQFRKRVPNEKDSDRSGWTETPSNTRTASDQSERVSREDASAINRKKIEERNLEMEQLVQKFEEKKKRKKEKREKSLLEIHRKKLRKKEKKEAKRREKEGRKEERRPFDRNVDLQIHRFDLAQRNAVLKKAALLNDRFASGESKFL